MTLSRGDPVRLTTRYAAALNRRPKNKIDWTERRGTVGWFSELQVAVKWNDRKSLDVFPIRAVEKIECMGRTPR